MATIFGFFSSTKVTTNITELLQAWHPIQLEDMGKVNLMNRQDTKYIFQIHQLKSLLEDLQAHYFVLEINGKRVLPYANIYFDTKEFFFYHEHQRGRARRFKVRFRQYVDSQLSFVEVKKKNNKKRTDKQRTKLAAFEPDMNELATEFLGAHLPFSPDELEPSILIDFQRITLVNKNFEDRCTIDFNLVARNETNSFKFENVVIAEAKQEKASAGSLFNKILHQNKIKPSRFSKYCMGMAMINPDLKANRFKTRLRKIDKIVNGNV